MNTASVITAEASAQYAGRLTRFLTMATATHAARAATVLLSVRSVPNGHPVQYAPNAYFWTTGPSTSPPETNRPIVTSVRPPVSPPPEKADSPVLVDTSIPANIRRIWTARTAGGTSPLNRMTAGSSAGIARVSAPRRRMTRYSSFPAGGWSGRLPRRAPPSLSNPANLHPSSVPCLLHPRRPDTDVSTAVIDTGASDSPP